MSLPDIVEIDLPTIIVIVVLWLIQFFQTKKSGERSR